MASIIDEQKENCYLGSARPIFLLPQTKTILEVELNVKLNKKNYNIVYILFEDPTQIVNFYPRRQL